MPFVPNISDIKQVLAEINKFYILVERDLPEDASQTLVIDMYKYSAKLQDLIKKRLDIDIPHAEALALFKDCLEITQEEENPSYIELTHHRWVKTKENK